MKLEELKALCVKTRKLHTELQLTGEMNVTLVIPKGWKAPKGFPQRTLLMDRGTERVVSVPVVKLERWITNQLMYG